MSQIVRIECSVCESVETHEMEGCILVGLKDGKVFLKQHDVTLGSLIDEIVNYVKKEAGESKQ